MLKHIACTVCALISVMVCLAASALACQIPVFRYALENWEPEPYLLIVAHRGELSAADKKLLEKLKQTIGEQGESLNLKLQVVDLATTKEPVLEKVLGPETKSIKAPQMVLIYPLNPARSLSEADAPDSVAGRTVVPPGPTTASVDSTVAPPGLTPAPTGLTPAPLTRTACPDGKCDLSAGGPRIAWSGDLTAEHIAQVVQSPVRKQIAARLLDGQTAVWVLLECGDKTKDDAAASRLEKTLAEMQRTLKLPDKAAIVADEHYKPETKVELRIEFSVIRIPAEHGDEAIFASTLLNSDPSAIADQQPLAISIFGRGRSYFALVGEGIDTASIEDHCRFITDDCSCAVKEANPGIDLLFAVPWKKSITRSSGKEQPTPELSGIGLLEATKAVSVAPAEISDSKETTIQPKTEPAISSPAKSPTASQVATAPTADFATPAPLSRVGLTWILGPAAIGLVVVLLGSLWLRMRRQS